ncbi:MAG TPA: tripartite tricarboxylate transporter TctB family protein [Thermodesulfobacteriota bacterium]|nr:tripartite tricarboxylate transporter TctB family protein [Thermodesulfobacteriota bacterium]
MRIPGRDVGENPLKIYDTYAALFLTVLGGVTCILAYRLSLGSIHNPGAGLIPFSVAALLGLMSIGLLVRGLLRSNAGSQSERVFRGVEWRGVALTLCGLLGYGAVFNPIGFRLSTFLLMLLLVGGVGRQKAWLTLTVSFFTVVFAYLIFVVWLRCPFPSGPFGI